MSSKGEGTFRERFLAEKGWKDKWMNEAIRGWSLKDDLVKALKKLDAAGRTLFENAPIEEKTRLWGEYEALRSACMDARAVIVRATSKEVGR